ncbi:hypothetical protein APHAL10511_008546 [Amanita phalloides]|nr:hypothetical protein APHAL10511_008546 [Amanita phalloides]
MASKRSAHFARSPTELPTEVIQEVFTSFAAAISTIDPTQFPWFLGHVCSSWRRIFRSMTSEFWTSVFIGFDQGDSDNERTAQVVRFFLERDPAAPFSFDVILKDCISDFPPEEADHIRQTLEMLVDASMRWKDVYIKACAEDLLPLARAKNRLPLLRKIQLQFWPETDEVPDALFEIFQNAPSLNVVDMPELAEWKFNLENLTAITLDELGSGASDFIAALPQLTNLELLIIGSTFEHDIPSNFILLPNVTTLNCKPSWLSFFEAHALKDLSIQNEDYDSSISDTVLSFLRRSSCGTNVLRLCIEGADGTTAAEIIKHTPQIVHLELIDIVDIGEILKPLTISTDTSTNPLPEPLARQMQSLSITFTEGDTFEESLMSDLLSSRTAAKDDNHRYKRLQKFIISTNDDNVSAAVQQRVIALCQERGVQYVEYD